MDVKKNILVPFISIYLGYFALIIGKHTEIWPG